jgi:nickel transport protein
MRRLLAALGLLLLTAQGHAHEVHATTQAQALTVVTLTYANGKPFAFEQFEVMPAGTEVPSQVGRTDGKGRAAVLALPGKELIFTATSKDGHGARLSLPASAAASAPTATETPRWLMAAAGGGVIFGLFGLFQLFTTRKRSIDT